MAKDVKPPNPDPIIIHGQYHSVMRSRAFDIYKKNEKKGRQLFPEFEYEWQQLKKKK